MKKRIFVLLFALILVTGICSPVFAQSELSNIQNAVVEFSEDIAKALPFNSSLGLNWADAHIGNFPHFGLGLSMGVTTMDMASIRNLARYMNTDISLDWNKMPIPAYTIEGRLGGLLLPFDAGVKVGFLPAMGIPGAEDVTYTNFLVGADLRFLILNNKTNIVLPNVSVGVGVNYLRGGIGGDMGEGQTLTYDFMGMVNRIELGRPTVDLTWDIIAFDAKAQVSKTFAILTPYLGVGGTYARSNSGYAVNADVRLNGNPVNQQAINMLNQFINFLNLEPVELSTDGISSTVQQSTFNFRAFGGSSINLSLFRLDLTGFYNINDNNFGGSLGIRVQL